MVWVYEDMEVWYGVLQYDIMTVYIYIGVTVCVYGGMVWGIAVWGYDCMGGCVYGGMEWLILVIIVVPTLCMECIINSFSMCRWHILLHSSIQILYVFYTTCLSADYQGCKLTYCATSRSVPWPIDAMPLHVSDFHFPISNFHSLALALALACS